MAEQRIGAFQAIDGDGNQQVIYIYADVEPLAGGGEPDAPTLSDKHLRTSTGLTVYRHGKGEYEILGTGIRLHSSHPGAP